jgi:hypothetical protein
MSKRKLLLEYDAGFAVKPEVLLNSGLIKENRILDRPLKKENGIDLESYAVLQKYGVKNNNNRIYPEKVLKREADRYRKEYVDNTNSFMEVNHPDVSQMNLLNIGGAVSDIWWEGVTLMGIIKYNLSKGFIDNGVVSTGGDMLANLNKNGWRFGVSSRGLGSLRKNDDYDLVEDDYELLCWDFVHLPSSKGSWVNPEYKNLSQYIQHEQETPIVDENTNKENNNVFKRNTNNNMQIKIDNFLSKFNKK